MRKSWIIILFVSLLLEHWILWAYAMFESGNRRQGGKRICTQGCKQETKDRRWEEKIDVMVLVTYADQLECDSSSGLFYVQYVLMSQAMSSCSWTVLLFINGCVAYEWMNEGIGMFGFLELVDVFHWHFFSDLCHVSLQAGVPDVDS